MSSPLDVLRETLRLADYHANVNPDEGREAWKALAQVEALVEAAKIVNGNGEGEFDTRTGPSLFKLREALAPFKDGD